MQRRRGFSWQFSSSASWLARAEVDDAREKVAAGSEIPLQWRRRWQLHEESNPPVPTMAVRRSYGVPAPHHANSRSRKNFKYRKKSITQRSLTEIEPSRKSAAAPEGGI